MKKPDTKMPSVKISDKLSGFLKPKPVFNKPLDTQRQHHLSRVLYALLLSLFIGISIAVIGLKALTLSFIEDNRDTGFSFETGEPEPAILAALPKNLYTAPAKLALIAAVLSIFIGLGHLVYLIIDWKTGRRVRISPLHILPHNYLISSVLIVPRLKPTLSAATQCSFTLHNSSSFSSALSPSS
jgi:hypothetical protein